ncbi:MAG: sigma 54-interacting transcriptional regulator [Rhodospirillales bacterium]
MRLLRDLPINGRTQGHRSLNSTQGHRSFNSKCTALFGEVACTERLSSGAAPRIWTYWRSSSGGPDGRGILITGQRRGKGVVRSLRAHERRRAGAAFVAVNCGNLGSELLENEMFGHARGAYTGANLAGAGLAAEAEGGTLFFDEVDSLPHVSQAKLLRFVQSKEYRRLGESRVRQANVRIMAASNADLPTLAANGAFREDLFFRLRVFPVQIKPLAERRDDLQLLIEHFLRRYAAEYHVAEPRLSEEAYRALLGYAWPGNVRELENCIRFLICMQFDRPIEPPDLPLLAHANGAPPASSHTGFEFGELSFQDAKRRLVDSFEREYVNNALRKSNGNINRAAIASGKHRRAFFQLMRKHQLRPDEHRNRAD